MWAELNSEHPSVPPGHVTDRFNVSTAEPYELSMAKYKSEGNFLVPDSRIFIPYSGVQ
jgi:hypothetical protein